MQNSFFNSPSSKYYQVITRINGLGIFRKLQEEKKKNYKSIMMYLNQIVHENDCEFFSLCIRFWILKGSHHENEIDEKGKIKI